MITQNLATDNKNSAVDKSSLILNAAYQLFLERGSFEMSVQEIADRAGLAKGTVYLYFRDKEALRKTLVAQKSRELFRVAVSALYAAEITNFEKQLIFVMNYVINLLTQNPMLLRLVGKDLSAGLFDSVAQSNPDRFDLLNAVMIIAEQSGIQLRSPQILLFMIIELISSTCYSCILENRPLPIQDYKPYLFETIRNMIRAAVIYS